MTPTNPSLKIASADLPSQARSAALAAQQGISSTTQSATRSINNFVDPDHAPSNSTARSASSKSQPEKADFWDSFGQEKKVEPEKKDFWDSFGEEKSGGIGTGAVKKDAGGGGKKGDGWGDW